MANVWQGDYYDPFDDIQCEEMYDENGRYLLQHESTEGTVPFDSKEAKQMNEEFAKPMNW